MNSPSVMVVGTGALGSTLARGLHAAGGRIAGVYNRHADKAEALASETGAGRWGPFPEAGDEPADFIFITVPDRDIASAARRLSRCYSSLDGTVAAHCSGSLPSSVLQPLAAQGAAIASFHPLQTFTAGSSPRDLQQIYFDAEGDNIAIQNLRDIVKILNSNMIEVNDKEKQYLHIAAVMASNNLLALLGASGEAAGMGGLGEVETRAALMPLVRQTLTNIEGAESLDDALSGPVARGDHQVVARHLKLLEPNARLHGLYKKLGRQLLQLPGTRRRLPAQAYGELSRLLED